jgi:hypothetical protein
MNCAIPPPNHNLTNKQSVCLLVHNLSGVSALPLALKLQAAKVARSCGCVAANASVCKQAFATIGGRSRLAMIECPLQSDAATALSRLQ